MHEELHEVHVVHSVEMTSCCFLSLLKGEESTTLGVRSVRYLVRPVKRASERACCVQAKKEEWICSSTAGEEEEHPNPADLVCGNEEGFSGCDYSSDRSLLSAADHASTGLILSGAMPKYILPEYSSHWDIAGGVTPAPVEAAIKDLEEGGKAAAAVFVTSPTYHGICSNLSEITKLCHSRGVPVIVDEAHGAHFRFHPNFPSTALEQGADLAVQSTHKVLSSLTQSSMLHASGNLLDRERITKCLQMLQSTSPSYLLLASLDAARAQIKERPDTIFSNALALSLLAKGEIRKIPGVSLLESSCFISGFPAIDPLRITLGVSQLHMSGYVTDEELWEGHHIIPELVGSKSLTFAVNLGTTRKDVERLISGFKMVSIKFFKGSNLQSGVENGVRIRAPTTYGSMQLSPRDAFFAKKRRVSIRESLGEICGELICPYPPGIPVLVPGEVITEEALSYLLNVMRMGAEISGASDHRLSSILVCT